MRLLLRALLRVSMKVKTCLCMTILVHRPGSRLPMGLYHSRSLLLLKFLKKVFFPCGGSQGGGEGVCDASPPSPDASQSILATHVAAPTKVTSSESVGLRKRPPDDSIDSDCSADDVLSDDPSLVPMPSITSGPKKPGAKKAARPTVVACHSLPATGSRIPVGKHPLKTTG